MYMEGHNAQSCLCPSNVGRQLQSSSVVSPQARHNVRAGISEQTIQRTFSLWQRYTSFPSQCRPVRLNFTRFDTEEGYDFVYILRLDINGFQDIVQQLSGALYQVTLLY